MFTLICGWLTGYVIIHLSGGNQERFLNLALQKNIELANMHWLAEDLLEAKVNYKQVASLKKIAKVTHCHMKIRLSKGLPFAYKYAKQRKALMVGILIFAVGIFCLSQLVFSISVSPKEDVGDLDLAKVLSTAQNLGLKQGAIYKTLDIEQISKDIRQEMPEISWVYIERSGTKVDIQVAIRSTYSEEEDSKTIGAIYASRTALIEEVLIKQGYANVAVGDTVKKGDLLVLDQEDGRADAIINARVWYEGYGEGELSQEIVTSAGGDQHIYWLENQSGNKLILWALPQTEIADATYEQNRINANLGYEDYQLNFYQEILSPQFVTYKSISDQEAQNAAFNQAMSSLENQIGKNNQVLTEDITYDLLDGVWAVTIRWECKEEIGVHADQL